MVSQSIRQGWNKVRLWVWAFLPVVLLQWILDGAVTWHEDAGGDRSLQLWWHDMGPQTLGIVITATILGLVGYIVSMWILLVVPGIIWGLRYCLYGHYLVTQGAGLVEVLQ
jgi:hypothetical protein